MALLVMVSAFSFARPAAAYDPVVTAQNALSCAGQRVGSDLGCTARDFTTAVTITNSTAASCTEGNYFSLDAQVTMASSGAKRYNIGFFTGETGNDPQAASAGQCSVATFPGTTPDGSNPWPWFESEPGSDSCGDYQANGTSTPTVQKLRVLCSGTAGGQLQIPYVVAWQQNDGACSGPTDVLPGTQSKCVGGMATVSNVVVTPRPTAEYRFSEAAWNGTTGEVLDSSGNGLNGTATGSAGTAGSNPAIPGDPGTCRYGVFDGTSGYVTVPNDPKLDGSNALTYTAWINPGSWSGSIHEIVSKSVHDGGSGRAQMGIFSENGQLKGRAETNAGRIEVSTGLPALGSWTHVALTFEAKNSLLNGLLYSSATLKLFVNGVEQASGSAVRLLSLGGITLDSTGDPLTIGNDYGRSYLFAGAIDEVRVYQSALNQSQVAAVMNETHPCQPGSTLDHFALSSSTGAVGSICSPTTLTVKACADYACTTPYTGGTNGMLNAAGTASVSWPSGQSFTIPAGSSTVATAVEVLTPDSSVVLGATGPAMASPTTCDFGSPRCTFTATGTGFIVSAPNQVAGTNNTLTIQARDCSTGGAPSGFQNGTKNINLQCGYVDPVSGTRPVLVNNKALNSAGSGIAACDSTGQSLALSFNNGVATAMMQYVDVGRMNITATYKGKANKTMTGTGAFVAKPDHFDLTGIVCADGTVNPVASDANGAKFCRASQHFAATVTARNVLGDATANFGKEITPATVTLTSTLVNPAGGHNPVISGNFGPFSGGSAAASNVSWNEVGIITLTPTVADYLGAGSINGTTSPNVGRFYPDHFLVNVISSGSLANINTGGAMEFTYIGQPFGYAIRPDAQIIAVDTAGNTTANYTGLFAKLTKPDVTLDYPTHDNVQAAIGGVCSPAAPTGCVAVTTITAAGNANHRLTDNGDGTLDFVIGGVANDSYAYLHSAATRLPPFTANLTLTITDVTDSDGVTDTAPTHLNPEGNLLRFGMASIGDTYGRQDHDLHLPLTLHYWNGSQLVANSDDISTLYSAADLACSDPDATDTLTCGTVTVTGSQVGNGGDFVLNSGGAGGALNFTLTVAPWLQYDWGGGSSYTDNPSATATFGIFRGDDRFLYWEEQ